MSECKFCAGEKVNADYVGDGITSAEFTINRLKQAFGMYYNDKDGIRLVDGQYLAFDNSAGEYAEQMISINYCPMCGRKIEPKEG